MCFEIIVILMKQDTSATCESLFNHRHRQNEIQTIIQSFIKEVCESADRSYKGYNDQWEAFMDMLKALADYDPKLMYDVLFKKAKFAHLVSPMMLDCDNLQTQADKRGARDKITIMKRLFKFLNDVTDPPNSDSSQKSDKIVKNILNDLYEQPGVIANTIFNLNSPREDDPDILGY